VTLGRGGETTTTTTVYPSSQRPSPFRPFARARGRNDNVNVIGPIYERKFIFDTYANRKGKGTHKALDRATYYMRRFEYGRPLDVRQYFPSIDLAILLDIL
jgi:hypothetical protein